ncbi:PREDICTED: uncharacterized protein LOC109159798 [Ipomoea nil]|uniref:uncharacterized protein LOC109159798 n=1 Tax=Ipomoea nil TaxID=35883 RepID=UPI0009015481|nr:PREDICTED: uncharacterized protein LOC109159798 [Ipomoea nil]
MSTLCWNCRGLGSDRTVHELLGFISRKRPSLVFIIETKATANKVEETRIRMGFEGLLSVDRTGMGGGLALFWRDKNMVSILSYSESHIDAVVSLPGKPDWRMTGFYGNPDQSKRHLSWDFLRELKNRSQLPWFVIGDFNDISCQSEKRGPHPQSSALIEGFNDALEDCQLMDLGMLGSRFTWERGRGTEAWVEERLDRAVATAEWSDIFEEAEVENLLTFTSDHNAIFLSLEMLNIRGGRKAFKFESAWILDEGCGKVVEQVWRRSSGELFHQRIAECGRQLSRWGKEYYNKFGTQAKKLRNILEVLRDARDQQSVNEYMLIEGELLTIMRQEEIFWKQRSKQLWLQHGDLNTKYFHKSASTRRRRNFLKQIKNEDGGWVQGDAMKMEILQYYENIFRTASSAMDIFERVPCRVTTRMNEALKLLFTLAEVKTALFSMAPEKAPGPDGMTPAFFQHFWPILGHDLFIFITNCVINRNLPQGLNESNIVLIPKKKMPEKVSDLRLIALCNVAYKVLAKMLANRLKEVLQSVVSMTQSAFVPDRLLTDNIIVAGEVGHYLRRKSGGIMGWTALKLDMAKAYDRMEWGFLKGMLAALGFTQGWIELLMMCVTTVTYNIQVNGDPAGSVIPTRGIRQGDPLSPYLFILCAEGLSILLQQAEARGDIHGIRIARGAPSVSHLFFADDSLLFFRATSEEAQTIKDCLEMYSAASGQVINYEKSNAMFSSNTDHATRRTVADCVGVQETTDLGKYLGLPSALGRNKTRTFQFIEQKVRERIGGWQQKLLSRAGKEVLLKSIAQALPIFTMSVFLLPERLCSTIEKLFNRYWWGENSSGKSGIHWMSWRRLAVPKKQGGMGFKRLHEFNLALLAKQGWRLLIYPDSLVARILKAKYYPHSDFLDAQLGNNPSYLWRSILAGQPLLKKGTARRIGNGLDSAVWGWPWLSDLANPKLHTPCTEALKEAKVSGLLTPHGDWDTEIIRDLFLESDVPRILATPVSPQYPDSWRWKDDIRGLYSVRHGYRILTSNEEETVSPGGFTHWHKLWKLPIPPKVKNLLWKCARAILPVKEILKVRRVWIGGGCTFCGYPLETIEHLLCDCNTAQQVWDDSDILRGRSVQGLMEDLLGTTMLDEAIRMAAVFWTLWNARNDQIWKAEYKHTQSLRAQAGALQQLWQSLRTPPHADRSNDSAITNWSPPPHGWITCNVDAALFGDGAGFGAVIRDHTGRFIAAHGGHLGCLDDPLLAEATAVERTLTWLKGLNRNNAIVETDCLNFSTAFNSSCVDFSYVGSIVKQCLKLASDIGNIRVRHIKRSANQVAHVLARATDSPSVLGSWFDYPPPCIASLLSY